MEDKWVIISLAKNAHKLKQMLESEKIYDKKRKIAKLENGEVAIPINANGKNGKSFLEAKNCNAEFPEFQTLVIRTEKMKIKEKTLVSDYEKLIRDIKSLGKDIGIEIHDSLLSDVPSHWEIHEDLVLFPDKCFVSEAWEGFGNDLWTAIAACLGVNRLAQKSTITRDGYRTPQVKLLLGDNSWVKHKDNGIVYSFDITKCMFSSGNITEKLRVGKFDCAQETVVDLYAGIGYFVLPYLVHAKASKVYACEWNEHAVKALRRNLQLNHVEERCLVLPGDNRKLVLKSVADRVNLGLIPSSEQGWPIACALLKHNVGGWLHIHGNVTSGKVVPYKPENFNSNGTSQDPRISTQNFSSNKRIKPEWQFWAASTAVTLRSLLSMAHSEMGSRDWKVTVVHLEHVKSYAPHIDHLVLDVECRPLQQ